MKRKHGTKWPQTAAVGIDLKPSNSKKSKADKGIIYSVCVICQGNSKKKKLYRVLPQSVNTLKSALSSRADSVVERFHLRFNRIGWAGNSQSGIRYVEIPTLIQKVAC